MPPGIFAAWQPEYAKYGLPTFPVGPDKVPAIRGYQKIGMRASGKIVSQFASAAAFGLLLGPRSGITVLDIDSPDDRVLETALEQHGDTPIVIRTASGNHRLGTGITANGALSDLTRSAQSIF